MPNAIHFSASSIIIIIIKIIWRFSSISDRRAVQGVRHKQKQKPMQKSGQQVDGENNNCAVRIASGYQADMCKFSKPIPEDCTPNNVKYPTATNR